MQDIGVIVMAVYHPDLELLERQILSLKCQTHRGWTCLVGIDGADGATRAEVQRLVDGDDRFEVREFADNVGVYRHFERMLRAIPSDVAWVALCDQDDRWFPAKLDRLTGLFADPDVTVVSGLAEIVDRHGSKHGLSERRQANLLQLILRNQVSGCFSLFRLDVIRDALPFPEGGPIAIHDHWLAVVGASKGRFVLVDEVLQEYVQHDSNVLGEEAKRSLVDVLRYVRRPSEFKSRLARSEQNWGWRVSMARALSERNLATGQVGEVRQIARGRLSGALIRAAFRAVVAGLLPPRSAVMVLVEAWWYPRTQPGSRGR